MIQKRWLVIGASVLVLTGWRVAAEATAYSRYGDCSTPAARTASVRAWKDVQAAASTLESARLGGSRYAAAKTGGEVDEALVRNAERRLAEAAGRLQTAKAACQVAE